MSPGAVQLTTVSWNTSLLSMDGEASGTDLAGAAGWMGPEQATGSTSEVLMVEDGPVMMSGSLVTFNAWFRGFHGYASIVVCIFGVCTNFFNITILMRKDMRTPTNILLMWLAVSDILTMVPYIPFAANFYCPPSDPVSRPERFSYGWVLYMLLMVNFAATTHTISIWIGVALAAVRFVQMRSTSRGPVAKERRIRHAKVS